MSMNEAETRYELIDPVLREKGYRKPYVKLETKAPVEPVGPKGRRRPGPGRTDYLVLGATRTGLAPARERPGKHAERYKPVTAGTVFYNPMRS